MGLTVLSIIIRILSNSFINVFQKKLTEVGQKSSIVNFYTYLGLTIFCLPLLIFNHINISSILILNVVIMGVLGAIGNYFIIKALSIGELSTVAPINSYKPVVAMIGGILYLHETPSLSAIGAILFIIFGSFYLFDKKTGFINYNAIIYRILALIFSATEAIFIKKIITLTSTEVAFYLWCIAGFIGSILFILGQEKENFKVSSLKFQILLIFSVAFMQYSTNIVFSRMNVAYALSLFQLSTILSIFFGANFFLEKNIKRKLIGAFFMMVGAIIIILSTN